MILNLIIPQDISLALKVPDDEKEKLLLKELAVSLYHHGYLSFGKARELAQLDKLEFHDEIGKRKIPRHYNETAFSEDLNYGNK